MDSLAAVTGRAPAAALLLAAIVAASLTGLLVAPAVVERSLLRPYWLVRRSEYATLVTSGFVHADVGHLLFNGITFWAFAFGLERAIGTPRFVALYAFGLLAGSLGTVWKYRADPDYRSLGASGAILGVLFASIVYFPSSSIYLLPVPMPIPAPLFAVVYLGYSWYAARRARGRVNHDAHLSGALAGLAFVAVTDPAALRRALDLVGA